MQAPAAPAYPGATPPALPRSATSGDAGTGGPVFGIVTINHIVADINEAIPGLDPSPFGKKEYGLAMQKGVYLNAFDKTCAPTVQKGPITEPKNDYKKMYGATNAQINVIDKALGIKGQDVLKEEDKFEKAFPRNAKNLWIDILTEVGKVPDGFLNLDAAARYFALGVKTYLNKSDVTNVGSINVSQVQQLLESLFVNPGLMFCFLTVTGLKWIPRGVIAEVTRPDNGTISGPAARGGKKLEVTLQVGGECNFVIGCWQHASKEQQLPLPFSHPKLWHVFYRSKSGHVAMKAVATEGTVKPFAEEMLMTNALVIERQAGTLRGAVVKVSDKKIHQIPTVRHFVGSIRKWPTVAGAGSRRVIREHAMQACGEEKPEEYEKPFVASTVIAESSRYLGKLMEVPGRLELFH